MSSKRPILCLMGRKTLTQSTNQHLMNYFLGRLLRVDLMTLVGLKCPSVRPQNVTSILMKFGV